TPESPTRRAGRHRPDSGPTRFTETFIGGGRRREASDRGDPPDRRFQLFLLLYDVTSHRCSQGQWPRSVQLPDLIGELAAGRLDGRRVIPGDQTQAGIGILEAVATEHVVPRPSPQLVGEAGVAVGDDRSGLAVATRDDAEVSIKVADLQERGVRGERVVEGPALIAELGTAGLLHRPFARSDPGDQAVVGGGLAHMPAGDRRADARPL